MLPLVKTAGDGAVLVSRLPEEGAAITHGWDLDLRVTCCRPLLHLDPESQTLRCRAFRAASSATRGSTVYRGILFATTFAMVAL